MLHSVKAVRVVSSQHLQAVSISELVCDDLFILYVCCDSEHTFLTVGSRILYRLLIGASSLFFNSLCFVQQLAKHMMITCS